MFGLLTTLLLTLFIVIFLGKDFRPLFENSDLQSTSESASETMMTETAVKSPLSQENKPETLPDDHPEPALGQTPVSVTAEHEPQTLQAEAHVSKEHPVEATAGERARSLSEADSTTPQQRLRGLNHRIHMLMQSHPFFHHAMRLGREETALLDRIAEMIRKLPADVTVVAEGHTASGEAAAESRKMAEITAEYLRRKLPGREIGAVGYGTRYPISDDPADRANRRVEIILRRREG